MTTTKGKMQNSFSCLFLATPAYSFAPRTNTKHIMEKSKLNEGMLAIQLEEEAWKELSGDIAWTESMLERYKDKVDWEAVCNNSYVHWNVAMLEKFRRQIDWTALSNTNQISLLTPEIVGQFKTCWDWTVLSSNDELPLETIEAMADCINWKELVNRYDRHDIFGSAFLSRFAEYIPASALKGSRLWHALVAEKEKELQKNFANI